MTERRLSIGKYRALQRASTPDGLFNIVAIDHQDALRRALNPESPESVNDFDVLFFKRQVINAMSDELSGVLLDPIYGAFQAIKSSTLGSKGLLVELEKADYQMNPMPLDVEIDPDWSVAKIKRMNADGVKLFFYYNPFQEEHAQRQDTIVKQVAEECTQLEIPFYAEPIIYDAPDKTKAVVEFAKRITALGVDVLKLEFPVDVAKEQDQAVWQAACEAITNSIDIPWVLLSAGVSFEMFARQLEVACKAGASGFIVGRALWGDAAQINDADERLRWLQKTGQQRLQLLNAIAGLYGRPWAEIYNFALPIITPSTFRQYPNFEDSDHA